jgi:hypothetical protein
MLGEVEDVFAMTAYDPDLEIETEAIAQIGLRTKKRGFGADPSGLCPAQLCP